jgi:translation elongation factor EF-Ts
MNGIIVSYMHHNKRGGAMVEILTETDFAANTQEVNDFGNWLAMMMYGFIKPCWDDILELDKSMNLGAGMRLEELKKEVKEEIKVGRCVILRLGEEPCNTGDCV